VAVPDASFAPRGGVLPVDVPPAWSAWLDRTPLDLVRELQGLPGGALDLKVSVSDLAGVAGCPRRFALDRIAAAVGLDTVDPQAQQAMDRGTLWHAIFETAGRDPRFVGHDPHPILAALQDAAGLVVARRNDAVAALFPGGVDAFLRSARAVVLPRFAEREAHRQQRLQTRSVEVEKPLTWQWPSQRTAGLTFRLRAKVDRIDVDAAGVAHVWDYKTGGAPKRNLTLAQQKRSPPPGFYAFRNTEPRYMAQLSLYLHLLQQEGGYTVGDQSRGGLITLDGGDSVFWKDTTQSKRTAYFTAAVQGVVDTLLAEFDELLHTPLREVVLHPRFLSSRSARTANDPARKSGECQYCAYASFCRVPSGAAEAAAPDGPTDSAAAAAEGGADA